ncbi:MAG: TlyA family RNA methyltransferase [Bacillota bacterium]
MGKKVDRLDIVLVNQGFFESRTRAQTAVMEGTVLVNGKKVTKPGTPVAADAVIRIVGEQLPYVSRGGLKLEKAAKEFRLSFEGKNIVDIGASTGGFTDCALKMGAKKVFAVDVGYGQLAWKLRQDPRVVNMERHNARYLTPADIGEQVDLVTIDASFISLEKLVGPAFNILKEKGELVALIKPQFEAGKENVGKKGVVKSPEVHVEVINRIISTLQRTGFSVAGLTYSPIRGPKGNIEYLVYGEKGEKESNSEIDVPAVVREAWCSL